MPTKQELESSPLTVLAVACGKVADDPSSSFEVCERPGNLRFEWAKPIARETPSPSSLDEHHKIQAEKESLKTRMVEFLSVFRKE